LLPLRLSVRPELVTPLFVGLLCLALAMGYPCIFRVVGPKWSPPAKAHESLPNDLSIWAAPEWISFSRLQLGHLAAEVMVAKKLPFFGGVPVVGSAMK